MKMLSLVESKISGYIKEINDDRILVNEEEKDLDEIIRNLRYESYQ